VGDAAKLDRELAQARAEAENITDRILEVRKGEHVPATLSDRLAAAEARVRTLEARRAAATTPRVPRKGPPTPSPDRLRGMLLEIADTLAAPDSDAANRALRARFEPVVLTPREEEWKLTTALKTNPAALFGRPDSYALGSCGGLHRAFSSTRARFNVDLARSW
jgi:hypothetical protein